MRTADASVPVATMEARVTGELPPSSSARQWLAECVELCQPESVRVLDGSPAEKRDLLNQAVAEGVLVRLNQEKLPGCYLHRSHPNDVARTEHCTYVCTPNENLAAAGPMPPRQSLAGCHGRATSTWKAWI